MLYFLNISFTCYRPELWIWMVFFFFFCSCTDQLEVNKQKISSRCYLGRKTYMHFVYCLFREQSYSNFNFPANQYQHWDTTDHVIQCLSDSYHVMWKVSFEKNRREYKTWKRESKLCDRAITENIINHVVNAKIPD